VDVTGVAATTSFAPFEDPDASWTGSTTLIDISAILDGTDVQFVTDGTLRVDFNTSMTKLRAGVGWETWSSPPEAEVANPHVLFSAGATSVALTLSREVFAFGFEIEPNPHADRDFTVTFVLSSGPTTVGTITRTVNGNAGARLIAARSSVSFDKITIASSGNDFAIAQLRYSTFTNQSTERVDNATGGTVTLIEDGKQVAGIQIPANTFGEDVTVTVGFAPFAAGEPCHDFLLGQIGRCIEITATKASGEAMLNPGTSLKVGLCLPEQLHVDIFKFESAQGPAIPLEQIDVSDFIDCTDFHFSRATPRNKLEGLAMGIAKRVGQWITPKPLYASNIGVGGHVTCPPICALSIFTWAEPINISFAKLAVNVLNQRDVFAVDGTFRVSALQGFLAPKGFEPFADEFGFNPSVHAVSIGYGKYIYEIPPGSFRYSALLRRYVYIAPRSPTAGIASMSIDANTGRFTIAGVSPTQGSGNPTFRAFTVQIGHRLRGAGLFCGESGKYTCVFEGAAH
jgi:hypothetical protein